MVDASHLSIQLQQTGGFSASRAGKAPTSGEMVSRTGTERVVPGVASADDIQSYATDHNSLLGRNRYLGGWHDTDSNQTYLDVSDRWTSPVGAKNAAAANSQLSRYNVGKEKVVDTTEPTLFPLKANVSPTRNKFRHESEVKGEIARRANKPKYGQGKLF